MSQLWIQIEDPIEQRQHLVDQEMASMVERVQASLIELAMLRSAHRPFVALITLIRQPDVATLQRHEQLLVDEARDVQVRGRKPVDGVRQQRHAGEQRSRRRERKARRQKGLSKIEMKNVVVPLLRQAERCAADCRLKKSGVLC
ncbi:hypothetical protein, partial [Bradyrhizobium sp. USDA 3364]